MNRGRTFDRAGYKGVSRSGTGYTAKYSECPLGYFSSAVEAALAYNDEAVRQAGEFARLNSVIDKAEVLRLLAERDEHLTQAHRISKLLRDWPCE